MQNEGVFCCYCSCRDDSFGKIGEGVWLPCIIAVVTVILFSLLACMQENEICL